MAPPRSDCILLILVTFDLDFLTFRAIFKILLPKIDSSTQVWATLVHNLQLQIIFWHLLDVRD